MIILDKIQRKMDIFQSSQNKEISNKETVERMSTAMNMHGLLAVLEDLNADLVYHPYFPTGRRETRYSPVPLTGVQLEVCFVSTSIP